MATVTILIRDTDEGGVAVNVDFGQGFDGTSPAHLLAADLTTELASEDNKND